MSPSIAQPEPMSVFLVNDRNNERLNTFNSLYKSCKMTVCTDKGHGPSMAGLRKSIQQSNAHILVYVLTAVTQPPDQRNPTALSEHLVLMAAIMKEKKGTIIFDLTSHRRTCLTEQSIHHVARDSELKLSQIRLCSLGAQVGG